MASPHNSRLEPTLASLARLNPRVVMQTEDPLKIVIREATEADLEGVVDAYESVADEEVHIGGQTPIDKAAMKERLLKASLESDNAVLFVAEDNGRIIGNIGSTNYNGLADLGMLLLPEYRGRGIGSKLVEHLIQWCRKQGCHKISLEVWPHNRAAIQLYEKFGFQREGLKRHHYRRKNGEIWDVISMGLILDEEA